MVQLKMIMIQLATSHLVFGGNPDPNPILGSSATYGNLNQSQPGTTYVSLILLVYSTTYMPNYYSCDGCVCKHLRKFNNCLNF